MKDFDIEKLQRQNIFREPGISFEDMQRNVLSQLAPVKETKTYRLQWTYSAAAAILLLFGLSFFLTLNSNEAPSVSEVKLDEVVTSGDNQLSIAQFRDDTLQTEMSANLTSSTNQNQTEATTPTQPAKMKNTGVARSKKIKTTNPETQVDQILSSFTSAEIADVSRNTEQDIYLDLYN